MGLMDKLLATVRYDGDDDFDDDEYYDDDVEDEGRSSRGSSSRKQSVRSATMDDDYDAKPKTSRISSYSKKGTSRTMSNGMEVCVIKPTSFDDSREITETLLGGHTVVLNVEGLDSDVAQRIIDFISGSTFAIDGNLQKISHFIFIATPKSIEISGDFQQMLAGGLDSPSLRNRF